MNVDLYVIITCKSELDIIYYISVPVIISFQSQNQAENEKYWDIGLWQAGGRMEGDRAVLAPGEFNISNIT